MWSEKYRPARFAAMLGNENARLAFIQWLRSWKPGEKPALLLGPPGTGKTTLVHAAQELGYTVLEFNASDVRTKKSLEAKIGQLSTSTGLFGQKLLIFLDEVDGIHGRADYGGVDFITEFAEATVHPLVMAANRGDVDAVQRLTRICQVFPFNAFSSRQVEAYLRHILTQGVLKAADDLLHEVVQQSRGDMRAAINSLQGLLGTSPRAVARRDSQFTLKEAVEGLVEGQDFTSALQILRGCVEHRTTEKLRTIYRGLMASDLKDEERAEALQALANLDEASYLAEVRGKYSLRKYFDHLLLQAVFPLRRSLKYLEYDELPWPLQQRIWNDARNLRSLAAKLGKATLTSARKVAAHTLTFFFTLYTLDRRLAKLAPSILRLEEGELKTLEREAARVKEALKAAKRGP